MARVLLLRRRARWFALALTILAVASTVALGTRAGADTDRCATTLEARRVTGGGQPIVVIGDSYSVGSGLASEGQAWPSRLDGEVHVDGFGGSGFSRYASFCGRGVSFPDRAPQALADAGPAAPVVVQGGLNDFDQPDSEIERGFTRLLAEFGDRSVLVVGPPTAPSRVSEVPRIDRLLARLAEQHGVRYLRMSDLDLTYLDDGLHLTAEGHRLFGDAVAAALHHM